MRRITKISPKNIYCELASVLLQAIRSFEAGHADSLVHRLLNISTTDRKFIIYCDHYLDKINVTFISKHAINWLTILWICVFECDNKTP